MTNQYFAEQATARKRPLIRKKASPKALVAIEEDAAGFQGLRVTEKESATLPLRLNSGDELNSACHAWSCTPAYWIKKYFDVSQES